MISLLNNKVKRGELSNISIVLNGFENKAKYGYGYGLDYGYGSYANGYHENIERNTIFAKILRKINSKKIIKNGIWS